MRRIALLSLCAVFALAACGGGKSSSASSSASSAAATQAASSAPMQAAAGADAAGSVPNCGAVQAVWVNLNSKVYHEPGDPLYGKTKHGEYLCPSQARAQGFRPAGGGSKHTHKSDSSM